MERGGNTARSLLLSGSYQLDVLRRRTVPDEDREAIRGVAHTATVEAAYGINGWLTAALVVPFVHKTQAARFGGGEVDRTVTGPADPLLAARLTVLGHADPDPRALRIGVLAGVKLPIGAWRASDDLGRIPAVFQAGTGSFDAVAGANAWLVPARRLALTSAFVLRQPTSNPEGYRFGTSVLATVDARFDHLHPLSVTVGARMLAAAADRLNGEHVHGSGGVRVLGRLGAVVHASDSLAFNVDALLTVYRAMSGDPLAPAFTLVAGATSSF